MVPSATMSPAAAHLAQIAAPTSCEQHRSTVIMRTAPVLAPRTWSPICFRARRPLRTLIPKGMTADVPP